MLAPPSNFSVILNSPLKPAYHVIPKESLIPGIPDGILALISPVVAYWTYASFFHIIDVYQLGEKYRIHPSEEEQARNKATLKEVLQDVVLQHIVQTLVGYAVYKLDPLPVTGHETYAMWKLRQALPFAVPDHVIFYAYYYGLSALRIGLALCFIDTWQYWLHRLMHTNKTLYRRFHSRHHRLYVPFSYGALYNDPVEGFLLDSLGSGVASIIAGLSPREALVLYTVATMKTVDDHCGYRFPWDPFQVLFPNNALYHDIHHQNWGFRFNYSQPFFTFWDKMSDTQYRFVDEYRSNQNRITLLKYKEFLEKRKQQKMAKSESQMSESDSQRYTSEASASGVAVGASKVQSRKLR